jgi:hypothetical protein
MFGQYTWHISVKRGRCRYSQISPNNVLQHGTLSTGLRSYDSNLGQVYGVLDLGQVSVCGQELGLGRGEGRRCATYSDSSEDILQLVHEGNQAGVVDVDAGER